MEIERGDIAVRLVEERTRIGYSQADFARHTEITREGLRLYEQGQRGMSAEFLVKAATLGVDVQYVLIGIRSTNAIEVARAASVAAAPSPPKKFHIVGGTGHTMNVVEKGDVIHTTKLVKKVIAEVKPGDEHIGDSQARVLMDLVEEIVKEEAKHKKVPKTHRAVWAALNSHCGVTRYRLIAVANFEKAEKYLRQWIGRLNSAASAPKTDNHAWRTRKYAYIKINTKDDPDKLNRHLTTKYEASTLVDLSDEDLEKVYRTVAGWKRAGAG